VRAALVFCAAAALLAGVPPGASGAPLDADAVLAASRAAIGSQPDGGHAFTGTDGKRVSLAAYRGKPLLVSFVYTGCSQVCPTTTQFLAKAVAEARAVVGKDAFHVASIGFNIPSDNPLSMKVFARQHGVDEPRWSFLTPDPGGPERIARDFGFSYQAAAGGFEHLTQVTILDADGRVYAQITGESFELPMLVQPLRELVLDAPVVARNLGAVVDKVRLLCTVYDPLTGKYRLDYALFIELGAGILVLGFTLGFLLREHRRSSRRPC
jgi:protein SCO1/2